MNDAVSEYVTRNGWPDKGSQIVFSGTHINDVTARFHEGVARTDPHHLVYDGILIDAVQVAR
jgi:hypothetical protein